MPALIVLLLSWDLAAPAGPPARRFYAGRPLIEALEDLRSQGLDVIYSSDLVRPGMRVLAEPVASTPRGILEDLISPHGLEARDGPGGTILIVMGEAAAVPTGGIAGRIVSGDDRRPAPGARISVPGTAVDVVASPDGRFLIARLPPGTWLLDVQSADGSMRQGVQVNVTAGEMTRIAIGLTAAPALIEGIVVTPTRYRIVNDRPESRQSLEGEELARLAYLGDDALRAAGRLPGAVASDKSAQISLRGGEWNETLVLLDGLEIDQPYHLKDFLAFSGIIDSRAIDRIDLLTGGFPVEYGDRMSGVIELFSSIPTKQGSTSAGTGVPNSWVMTDGRTVDDEKRWLVATRGWYPVKLREGVDPGGEDLDPYYYDMLGKFEAQRDSGAMISGHVLAARGSMDFLSREAGEETRARYDTQYAWLNLKSPWTPRLYSLTQFSAGSLKSNRFGSAEDLGEEIAQVADERGSAFFGAKQDWFFRGSDQYVLKWGFDARALHAEYDYASHSQIDDPIFAPTGAPIVVDRRIQAQPSGLRLEAYAAAKAKVLAPLTVEAGLRWGRQTYSGDEQIDPRVNLVWAAGQRTTVRAAWGLFHQSQRIDELQVEDGVRDFFPAQRAEHRLVSVEHDFDAGYRFKAAAYWKEMSHLRPRFENLFNPIELIPEGESDRIEIAPSGATAKGLELFLRGGPSKAIDWWAGYTLSSADDEVSGRSEPRSWDQRHTLNWGLGWRIGPGWEVDLAGTHHTGWPTTRVEARSVTDPNGGVSIQPTLGPRNAERFPSYGRLDLKLVRRVRLPESTLTVLLEVLNVLNQRNVCCVDEFRFLPRAGGAVKVDGVGDTWMERVPTFGIAWEF